MSVIISTINKLATIVDHAKKHELLSLDESLVAILILDYVKEHNEQVVTHIREVIANGTSKNTT